MKGMTHALVFGIRASKTKEKFCTDLNDKTRTQASHLIESINFMYVYFAHAPIDVRL